MNGVAKNSFEKFLNPNIIYNNSYTNFLKLEEISMNEKTVHVHKACDAFM